MKYDVTIGIPIYNGEKYIRETFLSALVQDYPSIEFLILDDCSTDASMYIIREYQQKHPRGGDIHIVSHGCNQGIGASRNRILDEAQGRYLYFLDADDLMTPSTISLLVATAQKYEAQIVMASYQQIETFSQESAPKHILHAYQKKIFTDNDSFCTYAFSSYGALNANVWNVLMDIELIRENNLRFVNTNFWEDLAFKYNLVTFVTRAVLLPDVTYTYVCRENTLSNFQKRDSISKDEVLRNASTIDTLKNNCSRLIGKPYFAKWLSFILQTDFYIVQDALKRRHTIQPKITDGELHEVLHSPLSVAKTLIYGNGKCLFFKLLSVLPARLSMCIFSIYNHVHK